MSGGKAEARAKSSNTVMVTVGSGLGGDVEGGLGGGADRGGGAYGQDGDCDRKLVN